LLMDAFKDLNQTFYMLLKCLFGLEDDIVNVYN
jgi:hypothetical protein